MIEVSARLMPAVGPSTESMLGNGPDPMERRKDD
jgi:hypothetical protein